MAANSGIEDIQKNEVCNTEKILVILVPTKQSGANIY